MMGKKAKKFALALIQADQGPVVADYQGQGLVEFPVRVPDIDEVLELRAWAAREFTATDAPEEQSTLVYRLIVRIVRSAIDAELTETDALAIINATGGPMSEFTYELARRFGVSDIHKPADPAAGDGGTFQDEVPI